jgi:hypothetical protein
MAVQSPAAKAAVRVYSEFHASLLREAREADEAQRPLKARSLRYRALMVARAALAEELDPEPGGLHAAFRQYSDDRGTP